MPEQLTIEFLSSPQPQMARLVLYHAQKGIINPLDKEQADFIKEVCDKSEFKGKFGVFLNLFTAQGPVLVGGIGEGVSAGQEAEKWGGKLFAQMRVTPFCHLMLEEGIFVDSLLMSVLSGVRASSYHFDRYRTVKKESSQKPSQSKLSVITAKPDEMNEKWEKVKPLTDGVFTARDLVYETISRRICKKMHGFAKCRA